MQKLLYFIVFAVFCFRSLAGQSSFSSLGGANFSSFVGAGVNLEGVESMYLNQAGIATIKNFGIDVSSDQRFGLSDLTSVNFAIVKTLNIGSIGILASSIGDKDYGEQKIGLAYARKLSPKVNIGGQFDYLKFNTILGNSGIFTFEIGVQVKINKWFNLSSHVFSVGSPEFADGQTVSSRFRIGAMYSPSQKVFFLAEADKLIDQEFTLRMGLGYNIKSIAQIRFGANPIVGDFAIGARFMFQDFKITGAVRNHNVLGNSPSVSLQYAK